MEGLEVVDGRFEVAETTVPLTLHAAGVEAELAASRGSELLGRVEVAAVEIVLPQARPWYARIAGRLRLRPDGLDLHEVEVMGEALTARLGGEIGWRGEDRVEITGKVRTAAAFARALGYLDAPLDGEVVFDGGFHWAAVRGWGCAKEYVEGMWRMLQQDTPDTYVLGTGVGTTVKEFLDYSFSDVGLDWRDHVDHDERYERPTEGDALIADPTQAQARAHAVKTLETEADGITRETIHLLHKTFITPLDRFDIHQLITRMDDILDLMEDVAQLVVLYDLKAVPEEARALSDLCVQLSLIHISEPTRPY